MDVSDIEKFNDWWITGKVRPALLKNFKRETYHEINKYMENRLMILLYGLRRMGKTTIMYQLIDELLNKTDSKNILYFSFDDTNYDLDDIMEIYQNKVINKSFNNTGEKIYIFLDEVQKLKDFENKIKIYYDLYPDIKFILSRSASISIRKRSNESLAGRIMSFYIEPLSFAEFLEMNNFNIEEIKHNYNLYKNEIMPMIDVYSKYGSFPELALNRNDDYARKYIKETVIDRIIYKDIVEEFNVNDLTLLRSLINVIANKPGIMLNFRSISENLGKDQRTISNYFEYLEYSFLIKIIYNYRENISITMRKLKKCYPITPNIVFALSDKFNDLYPYIIENLVLMKIKTDYFYRNNYEVDFIEVHDEKIKAIEIKKTDREMKQLKLFTKKYENVEPLMVTYDKEKHGDIDVMPLWVFLLQ